TRPLVSVVVVNHNSGPHLAACLDDLDRQRKSLGLEVLVIDNASQDQSLAQAQEAHPWAVFQANALNLGFARGCNQGLKEARGRFLMLLNPDTRLRDGALASLAEFLAARPEAGAAGPRILDPDGTVQYSARQSQGPLALLFNRYSLLTKLWPGNPVSRRYLLSDWDHSSEREVDWLSGAALMVRREAMEAAGLMDETFFLFHEDVDWCKRIQSAGFKILFWPQAEIIHHIGISQDKSSIRLLEVRHRSMIHYVHKHYRRLGPLLWPADLILGLRFGLLAALSLFRKKN
ncbi:MAG: glycosyltransferase family 2 protein, partial [Deltaproteobacteria bacterium]|nr:glycosyltransferase family 2 protein [Deltaproteobacteria bacterium]